MQLLQLDEGGDHFDGKSFTLMVTRIVQKLIHQVGELLVTPEEFDLLCYFRVSLDNELIVFLQIAHDQ